MRLLEKLTYCDGGAVRERGVCSKQQARRKEEAKRGRDMQGTVGELQKAEDRGKH